MKFGHGHTQPTSASPAAWCRRRWITTTVRLGVAAHSLQRGVGAAPGWRPAGAGRGLCALRHAGDFSKIAVAVTPGGEHGRVWRGDEVKAEAFGQAWSITSKIGRWSGRGRLTRLTRGGHTTPTWSRKAAGGAADGGLRARRPPRGHSHGLDRSQASQPQLGRAAHQVMKHQIQLSR